MATPEMTNVFNFMELRAPYSPEAKALRQNYIRDDFMGFLKGKPCRLEADLQSETSRSEVGKLIYRLVFCPRPDENANR